MTCPNHFSRPSGPLSYSLACNLIPITRQRLKILEASVTVSDSLGPGLLPQSPQCTSTATVAAFPCELLSHIFQEAHAACTSLTTGSIGSWEWAGNGGGGDDGPEFPCSRASWGRKPKTAQSKISVFLGNRYCCLGHCYCCVSKHKFPGTPGCHVSPLVPLTQGLLGSSALICTPGEI